MATWRDVRRIAGRLENVEESTCFGEPCLRVKRKLFAWMSTHEKDALAVRVDPDEQELIVAARPRLFFVTPHYRGYGAVLVRMEEATARDLAGPIEESYRLTLASRKRKTTLRDRDAHRARARPPTKAGASVPADGRRRS